MDALSSAFGQLLHSTEVKKQFKATAVPHICQAVSICINLSFNDT